MVRLSDDPRRAEEEMHALIFYLTTFGWIDGDFDAREKSFVRATISRLIAARARAQMGDVAADVHAEIVAKYSSHFHEVLESIDQSVQDLMAESVRESEDPNAFVHTKLKTRCYEILRSFEPAEQENLLSLIDELLSADGDTHPAELAFRAEMAALLEADLGVELEADDTTSVGRISVSDLRAVPAAGDDHAFFAPVEQHYSSDPKRISDQLGADAVLIDRALRTLATMRASGDGKLGGVARVTDLPRGSRFLDGHVLAHRLAPGQRAQITVLGDLHGCYSILKATLLQSGFFDRVDAYRRAPDSEPYPLLVLLGDYIDRGLFSLNGVLRTVLQLFVTAPEHVVPLRGNHEYFIEHQGMIYGGVKPAESINTLKPHASADVFRRYAELFDALPNVLLFEDIFFVHGGIPRDRALKEKWVDLSTLNDADLRFQMMWSDPSRADVIPAQLQDGAARFAFGRLQFHSFMQRVGSTLMVRGHERTDSGFAVAYDDGPHKLVTLFSSGGSSNGDLPSQSSYRSVDPKALTIHFSADAVELVPWEPDYQAYNDPQRNAFFRVPPEIEHRS